MPHEPGTAAAVRPPQSATNFALSLVGLLAGLGLVWVIAPFHASGPPSFTAFGMRVPYAPLIPCAGIVLVIATVEWLFPALRPPSPHSLARHAVRPFDWRRVGIRLCGLAATLAGVAAAYWLLPEYHGDFYEPYWQFLRTIAPAAVLVPLYLCWADTRAPQPTDEYHAMGLLVLGGWRRTDWRLIRLHLLGWTIKAFFLPLMTVYLGNELRSLYAALDASNTGSVSTYQVFYHLSYAIDLLFCVVGYGATIRLFDAGIRSVEPSVAGWLVALVCYQPFYSVIGRFYLQYDDQTFWDNWLQPWPAVQAVWGTLIILLSSIYALCTVAFGLRFSNLTHRGIITGGPYRLSKHPAYLAKNLSWWLISVPFVSELGWAAALRNCCLLALLNLLYFARARTEERHLSHDPTYVAYALWINEHGLLRRLGRLLPSLRYRPPGDAAPAATSPAAGPTKPPHKALR